jgi:acetoin utilization deacetylase AcuC-like enzyme
MKVIFAEQQLQHAPQTMIASGSHVPHPEQPQRATRLLAAARSTGLVAEAPLACAEEFIDTVHTPRYLTYLQNIFPRWSRIPDGSAEVTPGIQPRGDYPGRDPGAGGYPASAAGQAGFHHIDLSSPIGEHTWTSALWSAHATAHAAQQVLAGERSCYALARPPGHHAGKEFAAGFCYLANTAIAVEALRTQHARVAVLDVDVHHGNGTQEIFYDRGDVFTVSIHAHPERFYPFFWGYANERGKGYGEGHNMNVPLPRGTGDKDYLRELEHALDAIEGFDPGALVIALGLDAYEGDPLRGFAITTEGFAQIARRTGEFGLPTVLVQEGGYLSAELGDNLGAFLSGFMAGHGE